VSSKADACFEAGIEKDGAATTSGGRGGACGAQEAPAGARACENHDPRGPQYDEDAVLE